MRAPPLPPTASFFCASLSPAGLSSPAMYQFSGFSSSCRNMASLHELLDEMGGDFPGIEGLIGHDVGEEVGIGMQPFDGKPLERSLQAGNGCISVLAMGDPFRQHHDVVRGAAMSSASHRINTHPRLGLRAHQRGEKTRTRQKVFVRYVGVLSALNGVLPLRKLVVQRKLE